MSALPDRMVFQPCPTYGWDHPDRVKYVADFGAEYVLASTIPAMIAEAVARERESCARLADSMANRRAAAAAIAIRARKGDAND